MHMTIYIKSLKIFIQKKICFLAQCGDGGGSKKILIKVLKCGSPIHHSFVKQRDVPIGIGSVLRFLMTNLYDLRISCFIHPS